MPTLTKRATGITQSGWTNPTNAYDAGTGTFATYTTTSTDSTIYLTGYDFSTIPSNSVINSVSATVKWYVAATNRWAAPDVQGYNSTTALGSPVSLTLSATTTNSQTVSLSGITLADLQSGNFRVMLFADKTGSQSSTFNLDYIDITVDYSDPPIAKTASDTLTIGMTDAGSVSVPPPPSTVVFVKETTGNDINATSSKQISVTSTTGNTLVAVIGRSGGLGTTILTGITDSAGNTWSMRTRGAVSGVGYTRVEIWTATNATAVTSITASSGTSTGRWFWNIIELSNVDGIEAFSADNSANAATTSHTTPAVLVPNNGLIIAGLMHPIATDSNTWTGSTTLTRVDDGAGALNTAYKTFESGSTSQGGSWTTGASVAGGPVTISFIPGTAPAADPKTGSDTLTVGLTESTVLSASSTRTDTTTVALTDTATIAGTSSATDTATVSMTETAAIARSSTASDTATVSVTETASISVVAIKTATDTLTLGVTESTSTSVAASVAATDTPTLSLVETASVQASLSRSDNAAVSLAEQSVLGAQSSHTDALTVSLAEGATLEVTSTASDTLSMAVTDQATVVVTEDYLSGQDNLNVALTEQATVAIENQLPGQDSLSVGLTEQAAVFVETDSSDTLTIGLTETGEVDSIVDTFYTTEVLADTPIGYWRMETTTAYNEITGTNNTLVGTPTISTGQVNNGWTVNQNVAISLGGTYTDFTSDNTWSVEAWFKKGPTNDPDYQTIWRRDGLGKAVLLRLRANDVATPGVIDFYLNGATLYSPSRYDDNQWHHVVVTVNGTGTNAVRMYVDGTQVAQMNGVNVGTMSSGAGTQAIAAAGPNPAVEGFVGQLDEVALYNYPLSSTRVTKHWDVRNLYVTAVEKSSSDTGALSVDETASVYSDGVASDALSIGVVETAQVAVFVESSDSLTIGLTDASSIEGQVDEITKSASDSAVLSIEEASSTAATSSTTDTLDVGLTETAVLAVESDTDDTLTIGLTENAQTATSSEAGDTLGVGLTETASINEYVYISTADSLNIGVSESTKIEPSGTPATLTRRGTGTNAIVGTWGSTANAYDGTPGTTPATYATWTDNTRNSTATLEITGYDFSTIPADATITNVTLTLRHFETSTSVINSVQFGAYFNGSLIGSLTTATRATSARSDTATPTLTGEQLQSGFSTRVIVGRSNSTTNTTFNLDYLDVAVTYEVAGVTRITVGDSPHIALVDEGVLFDLNQTLIESTDTATVGLTEVSSIAITSTTTDTATVGLSETATLNAATTRADTVTIGLSEQATVAGTSSATDTAALAVTETATVLVLVDTADQVDIAVLEDTASFIGLLTDDEIALWLAESGSVLAGQPMRNLFRWDGAGWSQVEAIWDGSSWRHNYEVRVWDGSSWV